jgi:endonuclease/exonuclease/phosphatase (EEP) superfamily protein YafD
MLFLARGIRNLMIPLLNAYSLAALGLELAWRMTGDRHWPLALVMLFSQWWLMPALVLAPAALLLGLRRTALGLAAVAGLFLSIYGSALLPTPTPDAAQAQRLTVATLNVGGYRVGAAEIATAVRYTDADLVVLQEVVDSTVPDLRAALAGDYDAQVYRAGKAVLSRLPLGEPQVFVTALSPDRPILQVDVDLGGMVVTLLAPHPHPPTDVPWIYGDGSYRPNPHNALDAAELAARATAGDGPVLLVGDLNFPMRSAGYRSLQASGLQDAWQEAGRGFGATWPAGFEGFGIPIPPLVRLDYVWHSRQFKALAAHTGAAYGSDHLPVVVTLAW